MKTDRLFLQPLGTVAGCLVVETLESTPAGALEDLPPWYSVPECWSPLLMCQLSLEIQEADGERQWVLVRRHLPLPGRMKERTHHLLFKLENSDAPLLSWSRSFHSHLCSKWLDTSHWVSSLSLLTVCLPRSMKPGVFSTLRWHTQRLHLSGYIDFQAGILWQSYAKLRKAFMSLVLINQIPP